MASPLLLTRAMMRAVRQWPSDTEAPQSVERAESQDPDINELTYLREWAVDAARPLADGERALSRAVRAALAETDGVTVRLGGRAGRLGECVVGTALLEGLLAALRVAGRAGVPIRLVVDVASVNLFDERCYRERYWPDFQVTSAASGSVDMGITPAGPGHAPLLVDLHAASDGVPRLRLAGDGRGAAARGVTALERLFRVGVRDYARRGPARRYADFVEDALGLARGDIGSLAAQPTIHLRSEDRARAAESMRVIGLREGAPLLVGFFQSVVPAKCYSHWHDVLDRVCAHLARHAPGTQVDILLACGPDEHNPLGARLADLADEFARFTGTAGNARVLVAETPSLRALAGLLERALIVLSNDSGPGHIAGALHVPVVTPYLPGSVYSRTVWASSLWHRGVTLEPSPFAREQVEAAVLWDRTDIIDSIPAVELAAAAISCLPPGLRAP